MLGQRDEGWRRQFNVGSLRDYGVHLRGLEEVVADPAGVAHGAIDHIRATTGRWWLHIDLDVLDPTQFAAQGLPDVDDEPGGLTLAQLTEVAVAAGCPRLKRLGQRNGEPCRQNDDRAERQ